MEDEIGKTNIVIKKKPIHKDENNQYLQIINYQSREVNQTIFHVPQAPFPPPRCIGEQWRKKITKPRSQISNRSLQKKKKKYM